MKDYTLRNYAPREGYKYQVLYRVPSISKVWYELAHFKTLKDKRFTLTYCRQNNQGVQYKSILLPKPFWPSRK